MTREDFMLSKEIVCGLAEQERGEMKAPIPGSFLSLLLYRAYCD